MSEKQHDANDVVETRETSSRVKATTIAVILRLDKHISCCKEIRVRMLLLLAVSPQGVLFLFECVSVRNARLVDMVWLTVVRCTHGHACALYAKLEAVKWGLASSACKLAIAISQTLI